MPTHYNSFDGLLDNNVNNDAIGVFDSGIGGLSVVKEIKKLLPQENIIYFGDIARIPYGTKSVHAIKKFTAESVRFLLTHKIKMIVIACNTISAVAHDVVINLADQLPVINIIDAVTHDKDLGFKQQNVGIIATNATISSGVYSTKIKERHPHLDIYSAVCSLFVPFIEDGLLNHQALKLMANEYLQPLMMQNINQLILGCTHYPLIRGLIQDIIGNKIKIIDPAYFVARDVKLTLQRLNLLNVFNNIATNKFFVTDNPNQFKAIGEIFLEQIINDITVVGVNE